jgi:hypothetical protein
MEFIKELRTIAASMNRKKFTEYLQKTLYEYYEYTKSGKENEDTLTTFIVESIAHDFCYKNTFCEKFEEFSLKYSLFISCFNKKMIVDTIIQAYFDRCKQDKFLKEHKHTYVVNYGHSYILEPNNIIRINKNKFKSRYPQGAFMNSFIYDKLELETLTEIEKVSKTLGPSWCILLKIAGSTCTRNGRNFGLEPHVQFATVRTDDMEEFYDYELCPAESSLPVSLEFFLDLADQLASHPDESYRTPQFSELKRIVSSHYLKEDLTKKLPVKSPAASSTGRALKI